MIRFNKVIPTEKQIGELYFLLINRRYSISHISKPSLNEHKIFVKNHPYHIWYLIYKNNELIGSVYIQSDNSVGINVSSPKKEDINEIINFIKNNHRPLPPLKSQRRGEFFVNVSSEDFFLAKILIELNKIEFQRSYTI